MTLATEALRTPVLLIIHRRPQLTEQVFSRIRSVRPTQLFVAADGPASPDDRELCLAAREIVQQVDWDCRLHTKFSDANLGSGRGPREAIDWVVSECGEAIILEDDCVPEISFFEFCSALLDRYRHDRRVMEIGGANYGGSPVELASHAYQFSQYAHTHGWATWQRAWALYDRTLSTWPEFRESELFRRICRTPAERRFWTYLFDGVAAGYYPASWDYTWQLARFVNVGLSAVPPVNLIRNIGYGQMATHTKKKSAVHLDQVGHLSSIIHPIEVAQDHSYDEQFFSACFGEGLGLARFHAKRIVRALKAAWSDSSIKDD